MSDRFELPSELTIYGALAAQETLLAWAREQDGAAGTPWQVSARDVVEVDGAGLQLLASLANSARPWLVVEPSAAVVDACRLFGLEALLDPGPVTAVAARGGA